MRFLLEFLKHPRRVGSICPSSRFLERRVVRVAGISSAGTVVELGAGSGGTTRAILGEMSENARLLSIDINPRFHACLGSISDNRLVRHLGNAERISQTLATYGMEAADVVVSGIPFSSMSRASASRLLEEIFESLQPGGCFVAYQISDCVVELGCPVFGPVHVEAEYFNLPPLRVYRWKRSSGRLPASPVPCHHRHRAPLPQPSIQKAV